MDGPAAKNAPAAPGRSRRKRRSRNRRLPAWTTRRRTLVLVALVAILGVVGTYVLVVATRLGKITHQGPLSVIHDIVTGGSGSSVATQVSAGKPVVLALYGYGGDGHDGAFLTDSILVVQIRPSATGPAQVAEVSIPRDWYVPVDLGNGQTVHQRINTAYADVAEKIYGNLPAQYQGDFGAANLADDTLQRLTGLHIDHFVAMDFHAFQFVVDAVGGVDVNVKTSFTDAQYPHGECDTGDCAVETVHFAAGPQHLDGAHALIFARSRHGDNGEGTDFARSRRQQLILNAVRDKVVGVGGVSQLPAVLDALGNHVVTDMSVGDAESLYKLVKDVPTAAVEHVSIDDSNFLYECGYPTNCGAYWLYAHDTTYHSIQAFLANVIPPQAATAERVPITVIDASGYGNGASARWAQLLTEMGLQATDGGTAPRSATTSVVGPAAGTGTATVAWLGSMFGASVTPGAVAAASVAPVVSAPATTPAAAGGVTLVLGSDEEHAFNAVGTREGVGDASGGYSSGGGRAGAVQATPAPARRATPAPTPTRTPSPPATPVGTPPTPSPAAPSPSPGPTRPPSPGG